LKTEAPALVSDFETNIPKDGYPLIARKPTPLDADSPSGIVSKP
jgi:hypothetical protein